MEWKCLPVLIPPPYSINSPLPPQVGKKPEPQPEHLPDLSPDLTGFLKSASLSKEILESALSQQIGSPFLGFIYLVERPISSTEIGGHHQYVWTPPRGRVWIHTERGVFSIESPRNWFRLWNSSPRWRTLWDGKGWGGGSRSSPFRSVVSSSSRSWVTP